MNRYEGAWPSEVYGKIYVDHRVYNSRNLANRDARVTFTPKPIVVSCIICRPSSGTLTDLGNQQKKAKKTSTGVTKSKPVLKREAGVRRPLRQEQARQEQARALSPDVPLPEAVVPAAAAPKANRRPASQVVVMVPPRRRQPPPTVCVNDTPHMHPLTRYSLRGPFFRTPSGDS